MPMYGLLEYSQNCSMTSGSLWNYYRDEIDDVDDNASNGKSFEYNTTILVKTSRRPEESPQPSQNPDGTQPSWKPRLPVPALDAEVTIPLKNLSNFWRFLDLPKINYELELDLSWTKICVLIEHNNSIAGANFMITSTKIYVPVVTLFINDNINFLENTKQWFKRTISWNKYR